MISRIRIGGYKTLQDAETRLGGLSVLLGPMGSGRTNFLEAVALVGRLAGVERLERAFAAPHRGRAQECLGAGPFHVELDVDLNGRISKALNARLAEREKLEGLDGSYTRVAEKRLRYVMRMELAESGSLRLVDEHLEALTAEGEPRRGRRPFFERDEARGRFVARVEKQGSVRYLGGSRRRTVLSEVTDLVYHPHPAAAREELSGVRRFAFEASPLRTPASGPPAEGPGYRGEDFLSFLTRLAAEEPDSIRRLEERLRGVGLERIDLDAAGGAIDLSIRGERVPIHLAPSGLLSLMAIGSVLECGAAPPVVLLDEPEHGLDPAGIAALARMLRAAASGRRPASQAVVVTGSAELAEALDPAMLIGCRRLPGRGTVLAPLGGEPGNLFRRAAIEHALLGAVAPPRSAPTRTRRTRS